MEVDLDLSGLAFVLCVFAAIVLFTGDPDLHDILIQKVQESCATEQPVIIR